MNKERIKEEIRAAAKLVVVPDGNFLLFSVEVPHIKASLLDRHWAQAYPLTLVSTFSFSFTRPSLSPNTDLSSNPDHSPES